jgi:hypothetical protein
MKAIQSVFHRLFAEPSVLQKLFAERGASNGRVSFLSAEEVAFFRVNGYVVKRGVLDPEKMARARDYMWSKMPPTFDPESWTTWSGTVEDYKGPHTIADTLGRVKLRGEARELPFLLDLLPRNPVVFGVAEQLLGRGSVAAPKRIRGIYCTFPLPDSGLPPVPGHLDLHPYHLGVTAYLDQVLECGGAFTVWPGSHRAVFPHFKTLLANEAEGTLQGELNRLEGKAGVEILGGAGDVIFWHHRLLHAASRNRGRTVRQAVLCDFSRKDADHSGRIPSSRGLWTSWDGVSE